MQGFNVVVVSSGAVGVGCQRLGLGKRPDNIAAKQALASVGQVHLMRYYDELFGAVGLVSIREACLSLLSPACQAVSLRWLGPSAFAVACLPTRVVVLARGSLWLRVCCLPCSTGVMLQLC